MKTKIVDQNIVIFHDGLSVHNTKSVLDLIDNVLYRGRVLNMACCSDDNPIEFLFSLIKSKYKKKILLKTYEAF